MRKRKLWTLALVREALIKAHRAQDWEQAKVLSQLKNKLKRLRYCDVCGRRLSHQSQKCDVHHRLSLLKVKQLLWVFLLCGCTSPVMIVKPTPLLSRPVQVPHVYSMTGSIIEWQVAPWWGYATNYHLNQ